ncbi:sensor histidine kinase [Herminiimonas fonticola]|uniref:histidine kinase n=1 Tax=Herminiimonas fonticola TaxID=303380 RepID=A0A4R6G5V1_9BURK|nr:sensor histidine kinase [Herminiimonas fonticola]RBA23835.1 CHASE3 domain [Herminiimonas fonticola]TDN89837.1 phospho-acceptor domain-containing protein [Herminiimonas fonticola]
MEMSEDSRSEYMIKKEWLTKLGLGLALFLLVLISFVTFNSVDQFENSSKLVDHTHLVIKQINQIVSDVKDAESAQRGYLITSEESFLQAHHDVVVELPIEISTLKYLTRDNPEQQKTISTLEELIDKRMRTLRLGIDMLADRGAISGQEVSDLVGGSGKQAMSQLRGHADYMIAVEDKLLGERARLVETKASSTKLWILFGNFVAMVLLLSALFLILLEIKHRKDAQRSIERTAAQLELTNKELESFSYSVSHDLRSPLRAIDGYSRMFEEDFADRLDDEGRRLLSVIRVSSKKMGQLIDDLLAFSRMGRKPVDTSKVDMNALVDEVWSEVCASSRTSLPLKKSNLPAAWGDRALLRQVLMNLLANAVKYSSKKSEQLIEITAKQGEHEVVYSVRDNGVGFDMRFYNKLFGVFQRLHTEHEFPGTGVGLAIAQRVIVRHGGRIWAESKPDEYTIFNFSLPKEATA